MTTENTNEPGYWLALGRELQQRTMRGLRHPSYVMFFLIAIIGLGPLGFWIEIYTWSLASPPASTTPIRTALVAFVPAFMASTSMQLIWAENNLRSLRATSILLLVICLLGLIFCKSFPEGSVFAIYAGLFSSVIALWTWWIANAKQADFLDDWSPDVTKGPRDVTTKLAGDASKFITE